MMAGNLVERALDEVEVHCAGRRKWLVFCAGVTHATEVRASLERRGHRAALVTGKTSAAERDATIAAFQRGELRALVNVNVLTTGFDAPDVDAVILMRATRSAGLFYQMVGRGMRPHPSKADCLVLDFGGNVLRHGPVDALTVREPGKKRKRKPARKVCPECRTVHAAAVRTCTDCGFVFAVEAEPPPKHEAVASDLPLLSGDAFEAEVTEVRYRRHTKPGKPPSLRVDYACGLVTYSEWVCLEHPGFAGRKGARWWQRRGLTPVPRTVAEALTRVGELDVPHAIHLRREGRFFRVLGHDFHRTRKEGGVRDTETLRGARR